ncbi:MAG TPA: FAD-binding protein, partial [Candidatus Bathyarchaeota archaeon]|nr:FAD-binding protein [Candidatus Bathyarchaeota archaeon]
TKEPVLVFPTLHYMNGGICINVNAQVLNGEGNPIKGFFAAGETTGGVHGKNRLMGNSLLEVTVYGRRAGISAAKYVKNSEYGKISLNHVKRYEKMLIEAGIPRKRKAPMLLPEYRGEKVLSRAISLFPI